MKASSNLSNPSKLSLVKQKNVELKTENVCA
jgi:hypothetical protein